MSGLRVLVLGNGPSSWELDVAGFKNSGFLVLGCNKRAKDEVLDFVFVSDGPMLELLCQNNGYMATWVVSFNKKKHDSRVGNCPKMIWADHLEWNRSTGAAAASFAVSLRPSYIAIHGMDAEHDNRTLYRGEPPYYGKPLPAEKRALWGRGLRHVLDNSGYTYDTPSTGVYLARQEVVLS